MSASSPAARSLAIGQASPQLLRDDRPEWGHVLVIPWDTEIFGFPVGAYQPGDAHVVKADGEAFRRCFREWASAQAVELVACTVAGRDRAWQALLPQLGFAWVEQTLKATGRLYRFEAEPPAHPVRLATPEDWPEVETIAGEVFRHGRYHADPRFPKHLADSRYRTWARNAAFDPASLVYVIGPPGDIKGFFQMRVIGDRVELGIAAVAATARGSRASWELAVGVQLDLKARGIRWADSRISTTNLRILNLLSQLGHRFRDPEVVFHWRAPKAPHLKPEGMIPD